MFAKGGFLEILNFRPSQISTYGPETNLDGYRGLSWVGLTGIYADFGFLGFWRPPLAYWNRPPRAKIVKSPLMTLQGPFKRVESRQKNTKYAMSRIWPKIDPDTRQHPKKHLLGVQTPFPIRFLEKKKSCQCRIFSPF